MWHCCNIYLYALVAKKIPMISTKLAEQTTQKEELNNNIRKISMIFSQMHSAKVYKCSHCSVGIQMISIRILFSNSSIDRIAEQIF
jgi:hypothetical protein